MCILSPATPLSDPARLRTLERTQLLNSPPLPAFDRLTRLAVDLTGAPVALVSLVGADRQFFKGASGMGERSSQELPLSHSLCQYVVRGDAELVVDDAENHPLVSTSAAVREVGVAAYLGIPLRAPGGEVLGSFCAVDFEPRAWTEADREHMETLAESVMTEIQLRLKVQDFEEAQHDLKESEARYRQLFQHSPEPILIHRGAEILRANRASARLAGVDDASELVGESVYPFVESEQHAVITERLQMLEEGDDVSPLEVSIRLPGDHHHIVESISAPTPWNGHTATQTLLRDVTARIEAEEACREHAERLSLALGAAEMGTWDYDIRAGIVAWHAPAVDVDRPDPSHVHAPIEEHYRKIHPDDRGGLRTALESAVQAGPGATFDVTCRSVPDGRVRYWRLVGRVLHDEQGDAHRMIGVATDVTRQRRYEDGLVEAREEAERARREAEEMARLKDAFLSNMSHEIRTPLTSIIGFAEVLAEEVSGAESEMVSIIRASATRLQDTLSSVLDLAQLESMTGGLEPEEVDVVAELRDVALILSREADRRGLDLRTDVPPGVLTAALDRRALHRVLMNLTSNAIKFTDEGFVRLSVRRLDDTVELIVEDTGIGMDPAQLPQLFQPFRQASEGLTRRHEGSGLGLTITSRLVELMNGSIDVETAPGEGTSIRVQVPLVADPPQQMGSVHAARTPAALSPLRRVPVEDEQTGPSPNDHLPRILALDDRHEARLLVSHTLQPAFQVRAVASAKEALAAARTRRFDLLLLDISLSGGTSGTDVLQQLREMAGYEHVPAVALTAHALPGARESFLQAGFDAYLPKPFSGEALRDLVTTLLEDRAAAA